MAQNQAVIDYWYKHYAGMFCTLCANHGVLDTRRNRTPAGWECGAVHFCICPNGQALREAGGDPIAHLPKEKA